ncbi:GNAT family N-acetyltransferase [Acinetobacter sp.]|uniref:GNAT family N-acetyltransferase n=1 Tax=Acinetobacter sp. TaxID=472 RepID=UPI002FCC6007
MRYADIQIETERLILRPFAADDAEIWFKIMSSPSVTRYWSHLPWQSIKDAKEDIINDIAQMQKNAGLRLAVIEKQSQLMIGMCMFFDHHEASRRGEIGYCLDEDKQGKGYMQEAMQAFIHCLQSQLLIRRLEADIHPENQGSAALLAKLGFEQEGYLKQRWIVGDEISDSIIYGLLLPELV